MKHQSLKPPSMLAPVALAFAFLLSIAVPPASAMDFDTLSSTTLVLRGGGTRTQGAKPLYTAKLYAAQVSAEANQLRVVMSVMSRLQRSARS